MKMKIHIFLASLLMTLVVSHHPCHPGGLHPTRIRGSGHHFSRRALAMDSTIVEVSTVIAAPGTSVIVNTMLMSLSPVWSAAVPSADTSDVTLEVTQTISPVPLAQWQIGYSNPSSGPQTIISTPTPVSGSSTVYFVSVLASTSSTTPVTSIESSSLITGGTLSSSSVVGSTTLSPIIGGLWAPSVSSLAASLAAWSSSSSGLDASMTSRSLTFVASSSTPVTTSTRLSTTTSLTTVTISPSTLSIPTLAVSDIGSMTSFYIAPATSYPAAPTQVVLPDTTVTFSGLATTITLTFSEMSTFTQMIPPVATWADMGSASVIQPMMTPSSAYAVPIPSIYVAPLAISSSQCACAALQTVTVTETYTPSVISTTSELPIGGAGVGPTPSALVSIASIMSETTTHSVTDTSTIPCTTLTSSIPVIPVPLSDITFHSITQTSTIPCTTSSTAYPPTLSETKTHSVTQLSTVPCTTSSTSHSPPPVASVEIRTTSPTGYFPASGMESETVSFTQISTVPCTTSSTGYHPVLSETTTHSTMQVSTVPCTTSPTSYSPIPSFEIDTASPTGYSPARSMEVETGSFTQTSTVPCTTLSTLAALLTTVAPRNVTTNGTYAHPTSPSPPTQFTGAGETGAKGGPFAFLLGFVALFVLV